MRRAAILALSAVACLVAPPAAGAAGLGPLTAPASATFAATLSGADLAPTYSLGLVVPDTRTGGSANGWNLTITSTRYTTSGGTVRTLATAASSITGVAVACQSSCTTNPVNGSSYPVAVPAGATAPAAVKFFSAASGTGVGTFTITPTVAVALPADTYAGTYTSTVTTALVAGP